MKRILYLLIILSLPCTMFGQDEYLARLEISGAISELGLSPSEEIWVATKAGKVYYTKQIGELWNTRSFTDSHGFGGAFERLNFFAEDTLMISGYIYEDGKNNFVYWSGNHGKSWEKVMFGEDSWLDAAYINNNGKAWMSGSSQLIYYTDDNGKAWVSFNKIEPTGNLRFSTIHFAKDERTGLFGSFWNVIYKTSDNCQTWKKIPTPLDQNKYVQYSKNDRPSIDKIRILGNYYIVGQEGKTFFTKSDSINWVPLPDVNTFEITENGNLYIVNRNLHIELYNNSFSKIWQSDKKLETFPQAIGVRNNKLFALSWKKVYKISPQEFIESQLFTNEASIPEPYLKLSFEGEEYGFSDKDILRFNKEKKKWYRFMLSSFSIWNAAVFNNKIIVADNDLTQYYFIDLNKKVFNKFDLSSVLFSNSSVKEIYFRNGSHGCFHSFDKEKSYIKKGDKFVVSKKTNDKKYLSKSVHEIDESMVKELIKIVDTSRFAKVSIKDLHITNNDIKTFKEFIDKEEQKIKESGVDRFDFENFYSFPEENPDFNFYRAVADSLFAVTEQDINNAFGQGSGIVSTTINWREIVFVFQNGEKVIISNSDFKPNYLYTPWLVNYMGLKLKINSIQFGNQINKITNGEFFDNATGDKNYAIFKIADYLYRKKTGKN